MMAPARRNMTNSGARESGAKKRLTQIADELGTWRNPSGLGRDAAGRPLAPQNPRLRTRWRLRGPARAEIEARAQHAWVRASGTPRRVGRRAPPMRWPGARPGRAEHRGRRRRNAAAERAASEAREARAAAEARRGCRPPEAGRGRRRAHLGKNWRRRPGTCAKNWAICPIRCRAPTGSRPTCTASAVSVTRWAP